MFGVIANSLAIAGGCIVGLIIKGGLPQRVSDTIYVYCTLVYQEH